MAETTSMPTTGTQAEGDEVDALISAFQRDCERCIRLEAEAALFADRSFAAKERAITRNALRARLAAAAPVGTEGADSAPSIRDLPAMTTMANLIRRHAYHVLTQTVVAFVDGRDAERVAGAIAVASMMDRKVCDAMRETIADAGTPTPPAVERAEAKAFTQPCTGCLIPRECTEDRACYLHDRFVITPNGVEHYPGRVTAHGGKA